MPIYARPMNTGSPYAAFSSLESSKPPSLSRMFALFERGLTNVVRFLLCRDREAKMAEVAIPRNLFADILCLIAELRPPLNPAPA